MHLVTQNSIRNKIKICRKKIFAKKIWKTHYSQFLSGVPYLILKSDFRGRILGPAEIFYSVMIYADGKSYDVIIVDD
jgi:hypothetical protein